jgi:hypothetical protein
MLGLAALLLWQIENTAQEYPLEKARPAYSKDRHCF